MYPQFVNPYEDLEKNTNNIVDKVTPQYYNPNIPINQIIPKSVSKELGIYNTQNQQNNSISNVNIDPKNINLMLQQQPVIQDKKQQTQQSPIQNLINQNTNLELDYYFGLNTPTKQNQDIISNLPRYAIYNDDRGEQKIYELTQIENKNNEQINKIYEISKYINPNKPSNSFQGVDISFIFTPEQLFKKINYLINNPEFNNNALIGYDNITKTPKLGTELIQMLNNMSILKDPSIDRDSPIAQNYFNQLKYKYYQVVDKMIKVLYAKYQDRITSSELFKMLNDDKQKLSILNTIYQKSGNELNSYFKQKIDDYSQPTYFYINMEDKPSVKAKYELTRGKYATIWAQFINNLEMTNDVGTQLLSKALKNDLNKHYITNFEKDAIRKYFSKYISDIKYAYESLLNSGLSKTKAREYLGPAMDLIDLENLIYMSSLDDILENAPIPKFNLNSINFNNFIKQQQNNINTNNTNIKNTNLENTNNENVSIMNELPVYYNLYKKQYIQPGTPVIKEDATYAAPSYTFLQKRR